MDFYCIGTSHQNATLDIREKFSFSQQKIKEALTFYKDHNERFLGPKSEIALLSTCNRFEIYVTFRGDQHEFLGNPARIFRKMISFIAEITEISAEEINSQFIQYQNIEAVEHLFRVACGLESQVLGEVQILGQVSDALSLALEVRSARHPLASLFQSAIHTAKRAHTETEIGKKPTSISSAAVQLAEKWMEEIPNKRILVIGAGEMSGLAIKAFNHRGIKNLTVINRTYSKALNLANQYFYQVAPFDQLEFLLQKTDIVITAVSVERPLITHDSLQPIMANRHNSPVLFLDIAMPRNIDPAIRNLPGVELINLDDLKTRLDMNIQHRQKAAAQVEKILVEELRIYAHWVEVMPTVGKLHKKAEMIRRQEVRKMMQQYPELEPQLEEKIDLLTRSLVKKILHEPSSKMRLETTHKEMNMYTNTLNFLFGLDEQEYTNQIDTDKTIND